MLSGGGTGAQPSRCCFPEEHSAQGPATGSAPRRGMWNPLTVGSGAVFGGMKLSRTASFSLLGGSGVREGLSPPGGILMLLGLSESCLQGLIPWAWPTLCLQHLQHPTPESKLFAGF